jgi:sugar lactone lactonase YvrE
MIRGSLRDRRSAGFAAVLLSVVCLAACKESGQAGSGQAGKETEKLPDLLREAISRGAVAPQFGAPLSADITRVGSASALKEPRSVAVDKNGNIYVADTGNFRVVKLDSSGKELLSFGKQGAGPGEFTQPWKIVISSDGNILVLDRETTWIHVYTADGQFKTSLAGPKTQLYSPGGIAAAPDGTIAIANTGVSNLILLTPDGQSKGDPITTFAGERLDQPTDAVFDSKGGLHIYQTAQKRNSSLLLHRAAAGGPDTKWIALESSSTLDSARLDVGPDGRIYMTDPVKKRILVYSGDGRTCNPIKMEGPEVPPFDHLTGIALDSGSSIYAVDGAANAIYRLRLRAPG